MAHKNQSRPAWHGTARKTDRIGKLITSENKTSLLTLQVRHLQGRFGLDWPLAIVIAELHYSGAMVS
jgi:hypothetical protein